MFRQTRTLSLLAITIVFISLLLIAQFTFDDRPIVRFCCSHQASCIYPDEVSASEINSSWSSEVRFRVLEEKPCDEMYEENNSFVIQRVLLNHSVRLQKSFQQNFFVIVSEWILKIF